MDEQTAKRWSEALRSGKYIQHTGDLRKGEKFCAEGVLCDIINPDGWKKNGYTCRWEFEGQATGVPLARMTELGMGKGYEANVGAGHPTLDGSPLSFAICTLNDMYHMPFEQIADEIDAHWETI